MTQLNIYMYIYILYIEKTMEKKVLTDVTRCAARSGHNTRVLHLRQAEITNHYLAVLIGTIVEQIFRLKIKEKKNLIGVWNMRNTR